MAWIEKRGNKYRVVWRDGTEKVGIPCATKTQAKAVKAQVEADQHRGVYIDPRGGQITVEEWSKIWMAARSGLKRSSDAADESRMRLHIVARLGQYRLEQVTPLVVRRWVKNLEGRIAPKTIRNCHGLLYSLMQGAVDERLIPRNPCHRTGLPESAPSEMVFLTADQIGSLLKESPAFHRPLFETLLTTGLRWGEASGLWEQRIDLDGTKLEVRQSLTDVGGVLAIETPKSRRALRTVTFPDSTAAALEPLITGVPERHVFQSERGGLLRRDNFRHRVWKPLVARAGLPANTRPHDLRHTHAAHLISAGVPLLAVSRRLGHASIQVTAEVYGHLLEEVDDRLIEVVAGMVAPILPTSPNQQKPQARAV